MKVVQVALDGDEVSDAGDFPDLVGRAMQRGGKFGSGSPAAADGPDAGRREDGNMIAV